MHSNGTQEFSKATKNKAMGVYLNTQTLQEMAKTFHINLFIQALTDVKAGEVVTSN